MRIEPLLEMELDYQDGFLVVAPYGGAEGVGYGSGRGQVSGAEVTGAVRWSNHPRRREDGVLMPDAHGVIDTEDGASILFHLGGYSTAVEGSPSTRGIVSPASFATDDDRYRWLNDVVAIGEGSIDFETLRIRLVYYRVVNEAV